MPRVFKGHYRQLNINRKGFFMNIWDVTIEKVLKGTRGQRKIDFIGDYNF